MIPQPQTRVSPERGEYRSELGLTDIDAISPNSWQEKIASIKDSRDKSKASKRSPDMPNSRNKRDRPISMPSNNISTATKPSQRNSGDKPPPLPRSTSLKWSEKVLTIMPSTQGRSLEADTYNVPPTPWPRTSSLERIRDTDKLESPYLTSSDKTYLPAGPTETSSSRLGRSKTVDRSPSRSGFMVPVPRGRSPSGRALDAERKSPVRTAELKSKPHASHSVDIPILDEEPRRRLPYAGSSSVDIAAPRRRLPYAGSSSVDVAAPRLDRLPAKQYSRGDISSPVLEPNIIVIPGGRKLPNGKEKSTWRTSESQPSQFVPNNSCGYPVLRINDDKSQNPADDSDQKAPLSYKGFSDSSESKESSLYNPASFSGAQKTAGLIADELRQRFQNPAAKPKHLIRSNALDVHSSDSSEDARKQPQAQANYSIHFSGVKAAPPIARVEKHSPESSMASLPPPPPPKDY